MRQLDATPQPLFFDKFSRGGVLYPFALLFAGLSYALNPQTPSLIFIGVLLGLIALHIFAVGRMVRMFTVDRPFLYTVLSVGWRRLLGAALVGALVLLGVLSYWGVSLAEICIYLAWVCFVLAPENMIISIAFLYRSTFKKITKLGVHVARFSAFERLGFIKTLFLEKTNVLTLGNLTIQVVFLPNGEHVLLKGVGFDASRKRDMWRLAVAGLLTSNTSPNIAPNAVDSAFRRFGTRMGLKVDALLRHGPCLKQMPFNQEKRFAASFHKIGHQKQGKTFAVVKGAPEVIAKMCGMPLDTWQKEVAHLAEGNYRTIALAGGIVDGTTEKALNAGTLSFLGLVALVDQPQKNVLEVLTHTVADIKLLTGDNPATALIAAKKAGFASRHQEVLDAATLKDGAFTAALLEEHTVFANMSPQQKGTVLTKACTVCEGAYVNAGCFPQPKERLQQNKKQEESSSAKNGESAPHNAPIHIAIGAQEGDICLPKGEFARLSTLCDLSQHMHMVIQHMRALWLVTFMVVCVFMALCAAVLFSGEGVFTYAYDLVMYIAYAVFMIGAVFLPLLLVFTKPKGKLERQPKTLKNQYTIAGLGAALVGVGVWLVSQQVPSFTGVYMQKILLQGAVFVALPFLFINVRPKGQKLFEKGYGLFYIGIVLSVLCGIALTFWGGLSLLPLEAHIYAVIAAGILTVFLLLEALRKFV